MPVGRAANDVTDAGWWSNILWAPRPVVRRLSVLSGGDEGWIWHWVVDGLLSSLLIKVPEDHKPQKVGIWLAE